MKIGVFGGAFNPIHIGHLITGEECRVKLALDKILFIPTYNPPHKKDIVAYRHRRNMVRMAIKDNPYFELCEVEKELGGTSWTIKTLETLHKNYPKDELYLIIGSDQFRVLNTWKQPQNLTKYANLIIMKRPGIKFQIPDSKFQIPVNISQIDIASKDIRNDIKQEKSVRYKVVESVYKYIIKNKLYRA